MKGIKAAKTVGTLALGFLTLVETAYLFGIGKVRAALANSPNAPRVLTAGVGVSSRAMEFKLAVSL